MDMIKKDLHADVISLPYIFYQKKIYRRISNLRGTYRLMRALKNLAKTGLEEVDEQPESIFDRGDWDNLLILDACRYDFYRELKGETAKRVTLGSNSPEFIEKTFSEGTYEDIVYITGNPHFSRGIFKDLTGREPGKVFHEVYNTYDTDWDEDNGVVMPEALVRDTLNAEKLFPGKRKIVHFMQPH
ncbi:MAG: hypothetical protein ABEJ72_00465, partial [Candidatus Aenigmatarchaeota archaeon]